jgi:hypothetical protein
MDIIHSIQELSVAAGTVGDAGQPSRTLQLVRSASSAERRSIPRIKAGCRLFQIFIATENAGRLVTYRRVDPHIKLFRAERGNHHASHHRQAADISKRTQSITQEGKKH